MPTQPLHESASSLSGRLPVMVGVASALILSVAQLVTSPQAGPSSHSPEPARMDLPIEIGPWMGRETLTDPKELTRAGIVGFVSRRYLHRGSGAEVMVLLMWGPAGPLSAHSPELCFGGAGYALDAPPTIARLPVDRAGKAEFFHGRFHRPESSLPDGLELYWAWRADGLWRISDRPRLAFAGATRLYKLYVARSLAERIEDGAIASDPCRDFLAAWLSAGHVARPNSRVTP